MRALVVDDTVTDLSTQDFPFIPNNTVVVLNLSGAQQVLEGADEDTPSAYEELATIAAGAVAEVNLPRFVFVQDSAGVLVFLGN